MSGEEEAAATSAEVRDIIGSLLAQDHPDAPPAVLEAAIAEIGPAVFDAIARGEVNWAAAIAAARRARDVFAADAAARAVGEGS